MQPRLSFVAYAAYPLLDDTVSGGIGGAEVRALLFARGLQQRTEYQLEFIVAPRSTMLPAADGIRIRAYRKQRGPARTLAKWKHSLTRRFTQCPAPDPFYQQLDTDVVLCFGVRNDTASIVRSARQAGKRTIVFLTSDRNVDDAQRQGGTDRGIYGEIGYLCRYALTQADCVVAQTDFQREKLAKALGVQSTWIRNPIDLHGARDTMATVQPPTVLWVGRADTYSKRADLCIELAKRCGDVRFVMVMNNHDDATFRQLKQSAPANVEIVEHVPFSQIDQYYQRACLLVNTSLVEGFPNSFLQAGKWRKPIVSLTVDPAGMLSDHRCGVCCHGDIAQLASAVKRLTAWNADYDELASNAHRYVATNHDLEICSQQLQEVIDNLLQAPSALVA